MKAIIERAAIQVDQWDRVEKGKGPGLENLPERAETLIDVLRELAAAKPHVLIVLDGGLVDSAKLYASEEATLLAGQKAWHERTDLLSMATDRDESAEDMKTQEPGYDKRWGGVRRGHVMHWWNDDFDIIVDEPE